MHQWGKIVLFVGIAITVAGCPKGRTDFNQGRKAQDLHDYDAAFDYYQKALKTDPDNAEYQIKFYQARFDAGEASGTGTIMGIVIKVLAPGTSNLSIVQVSAKDSQRLIQLVTGEPSVQVKP
jgi:tetratricopeptide (TPR) repeat protein